MSITTYQAYTMAEALAAVRRDIGPDAIILHTRTFKRGGFFGLWRRTIVEVTARTGEGQRAASSSPTRSSARIRGADANAARQAYARISHSAAGGKSPAQPGNDAPASLDRNRTRRLAQALAERHERELGGTVKSVSPATLAAMAVAVKEEAAAPDASSEHHSVAHTPAPAVARRFVLRSAEESPGLDSSAGSAHKASAPAAAERGPEPRHAGELASSRSQPAGVSVAARGAPHGGASGSSAPAAVMQDELATIKDMLGEVLQRQVVTGGRPAPTMPKALFDTYLRLISQDLSEELANRIVDQVRDELAGDLLNDEQAVREAVARHLAEFVPVVESSIALVSPDGRPYTVALVGPTGVGKTTTLAKLAATFKLRHQRKVGLITCDTYRIAAVDQLRTYAGIIGLPLEVVLTPSQMRQAMLSLGGCDVILIDTAGRGPSDTARLDELKQFIEAARPHEVHLVLSGTASEKVLLREAEAFAPVGVDRLVLTKLDEAVSFGVLINVTRQIGKKLSFLTTGQEVPNHIEPGRPMRLAELVLGVGQLSEPRGREPALRAGVLA